MSPGAVAIVHERFTEWGGSEQVVAELHALWPAAPIHTTVVDRAILRGNLVEAEIIPSPLQHLYRAGRQYAHLLPLLPGAVRRLRLGAPDLVIASHHAFANRVTVPDGARFISYVHTPARWLWDPTKRRSEAGGAPGRALLAAFAATERRPDAIAARRAAAIVANSNAVADRIERWWGLPSSVVAPPVDTGYFTPGPPQDREDFFLLAGRLVPYKRPEVAVRAARRAGVRLVVAGDGRMAKSIPPGEGLTMLGSVPRAELRRLFRSCRALVFPGEEDFGIVPVEAQACGAPVIALRRGGALDTVVDGVTGVLYDAGGDEVASLAGVLRDFDPGAYDAAAVRANAERFAVGVFHAGMRRAVASGR